MKLLSHEPDCTAVVKCRGAARRHAQAEHKADVLAEENASLILELDARPTAKQYKSLQCQMDILERRLDKSKLQAQGSGTVLLHLQALLPVGYPFAEGPRASAVDLSFTSQHVGSLPAQS